MNLDKKFDVQQSLKCIDEALMCAICKEQFSTPVIISVCSHNFCSVCIRRYFTIKQECPVCGMGASCTNLVPNRILETFTKHISNLRLALQCMVDQEKNGLVQLQNIQKGNNALKHSNELPGSSCNKQAKESSNSSTLASQEFLESEVTQKFSLGLKDFCTQSQDFPGDSCNQVSDANLLIDDKDASNLPIAQSNNEAETPMITNGETTQPPEQANCPVCGSVVATEVINSHLDSCLAREEKKNALRKNTPKRLKRNNPSMAKLAYSLLSLRELRKKMKEIGLPSNGNKVELKRRHLEFLVKYQAEMDKSEPRSVEVIIEELKREESKKKELEGKASFVTMLSPGKSTDSAKDNQKHMQKHAKQYQQLEELAEQSLPKKRRKKTKDHEANWTSNSNCNLMSAPSSESIVPESQLSLQSVSCGVVLNHTSLSPDFTSGSSPELYIDEPSSSAVGAAKTNLREALQSDSQAEEIRHFIDASLSEAY